MKVTDLNQYRRVKQSQRIADRLLEADSVKRVLAYPTLEKFLTDADRQRFMANITLEDVCKSKD